MLNNDCPEQDEEYDMELDWQQDPKNDPSLKSRPFNPLLKTFNKRGKQPKSKAEESIEEMKSKMAGQKRLRDPPHYLIPNVNENNCNNNLNSLLIRHSPEHSTLAGCNVTRCVDSSLLGSSSTTSSASSFTSLPPRPG